MEASRLTDEGLSWRGLDTIARFRAKWQDNHDIVVNPRRNFIEEKSQETRSGRQIQTEELSPGTRQVDR
jgi:hypothetical protein